MTNTADTLAAALNAFHAGRNVPAFKRTDSKANKAARKAHADRFVAFRAAFTAHHGLELNIQDEVYAGAYKGLRYSETRAAFKRAGFDVTGINI